MLTEDDGTEIACVNLTVRPDGWKIPPEATSAHGITTERALQIGVPLTLVVACFTNLRAIATELVAHNIDFDQRIMRYAMARVKAMTGKAPAHSGPGKITCTLRMATPIVNLPPTPKMVAAGFNKPKPPQLGECYQHFFGEKLQGAHDALVDVRACKRIHRHMLNLATSTAAVDASYVEDYAAAKGNSK